MKGFVNKHDALQLPNTIEWDGGSRWKRRHPDTVQIECGDQPFPRFFPFLVCINNYGHRGKCFMRFADDIKGFSDLGEPQLE